MTCFRLQLMKAFHRFIPGIVTILLLVASPVSLADTTINLAEKYAHGANIGWINLAGDGSNGVVAGEHFFSGSAYSANAGWISFGDGTPANGFAYANDSATDFGVNHDGSGNLSGYAYGANVGWISFDWASAIDLNRPRLNLITGDFEGYAYGTNVGWINFGTGYLSTDTIFCPDSDNDGIADAWEILQFGNIFIASATSDLDADGVLDRDEYFGGSDPNQASSYLRFLSRSLVPGAFPMMDLTLEFPSTSTRLYRILVSDDLGTFTDSGLGTFTPDAGPTTTKVVTVNGSRKFVRVVALKPLQQ